VSERVLLGQTRVLLTGVRNPQAYAADDSLYGSQDLTPPADSAHGIVSELEPPSRVQSPGYAYPQPLTRVTLVI
jgi:hypothetical protein